MGRGMSIATKIPRKSGNKLDEYEEIDTILDITEIRDIFCRLLRESGRHFQAIGKLLQETSRDLRKKQ